MFDISFDEMFNRAYIVYKVNFDAFRQGGLRTSAAAYTGLRQPEASTQGLIHRRSSGTLKVLSRRIQFDNDFVQLMSRKWFFLNISVFTDLLSCQSLRFYCHENFVRTGFFYWKLLQEMLLKIKDKTIHTVNFPWETRIMPSPLFISALLYKVGQLHFPPEATIRLSKTFKSQVTPRALLDHSSRPIKTSEHFFSFMLLGS